jgi:uncharacterized protein (DUF2236 family)
MPDQQDEPLSFEALARPIKQAIIANVVAVFNDKSRGEKSVKRRPDGLFDPGAVAWRVHSDVTPMMVGGIAGLLPQMLHPAVPAGVWDHANFRNDMHGGLRRTARFITLTTFGGREEANAANDPALLARVHATETTSLRKAWMRYAEPDMSVADQDRYFAEMVRVAEPLGADPTPRTKPRHRP